MKYPFKTQTSCEYLTPLIWERKDEDVWKKGGLNFLDKGVFVNIITADVWEMQYIARLTYHPNCNIFRDVTSKRGWEQLICLFGSRTNMYLWKLQIHFSLLNLSFFIHLCNVGKEIGADHIFVLLIDHPACHCCYTTAIP